MTRQHKPLFDPMPVMLQMLDREGISEEMLLSAAGLEDDPPPSDPLRGLSRLLKLQEAAEHLSQTPGFSFRLGQQLDISSLKTIGFALLSCPDLRSVIRLMLRFHPLLAGGRVWTIVPHPGGLAMRYHLPIGSPEQTRLHTEMIFSQVVTIAEFLTNETLDEAQLHLSCVQQVHFNAYARPFKPSVLFEQEFDQLVIPERMLDAPITTANSVAHTIFVNQCEDLLRELNVVENYSATIRRLLIQSSGEFPDFARVAGKMCMSERTLRRRLDSERTSFRAIVDEVRNLMATEYLDGTEFTVADIAHLLGYAEAMHFRRAFHRWNRMTPQQYRQRQIRK